MPGAHPPTAQGWPQDSIMCLLKMDVKQVQRRRRTKIKEESFVFSAFYAVQK